MADPTKEKFALITGLASDVSFTFSDSALDMATKSPAGFIWNDSMAIPAGFAEFGMFSALHERYIGYAPLDRDRFEIAIYTAKLEPTRIALAVDYARIFATRWGDLNFGMMPHSPVFGEQLGGDNSSGLMIITRISVFRRGDEALIIRSKFHAEHFESYARAMAEFIGNVAFTDSTTADIIADEMTIVQRPVQSDGSVFSYKIPPHWELLITETPPSGSGAFDLWIDTSDPNRNLATMVAVISPPKAMPAAHVQPNPQQLANLSYDMAQSAVATLLPDTVFTLEPLSKTTFPDLDTVTMFNADFAYAAKIGTNQTPAQVSVLMSMGRRGTIIANTLIAPGPLDPYLIGTSMVGNFIRQQQLDAQIAYWQGVKTTDGDADQ